jgi:hypothetical protein
VWRLALHCAVHNKYSSLFVACDGVAVSANASFVSGMMLRLVDFYKTGMHRWFNNSRLLCGSVNLNSENTGAFILTQSLMQIRCVSCSGGAEWELPLVSSKKFAVDLSLTP